MYLHCIYTVRHSELIYVYTGSDSSLLELPDFGCGHSRSVMIPSSPELEAASDASDALGELRSGADSRTMPPPSGLPSSPRSPVVDRGVCLFLTLLVDL